MGFENMPGKESGLKDVVDISDETIYKELDRLQGRIKAIESNDPLLAEKMSQEEKKMTSAQRFDRLEELKNWEKQWRAALGTGKIDRDLFDTRYNF